jgi:hypothetical protein
MSFYPQEYAVGTVIEYQVLDREDNPKDISSASSKKLIFKKPDGQTFIKLANFSTDGIDGKLSYTTIANDLTPWGTWQVQADLVMSGFDSPTEIVTFEVLKNLNDGRDRYTRGSF